MNKVETSRGSPERAELIQAAKVAYENAYAPYSNYRVGAAVLADDGQVYAGCNVENAVYPLTMCAERVAIFKAISAGAKSIRAVAVVTANGGSPCGSCRQVMREFAPDTMPVYVADLEGRYATYHMADLLPVGFSSKDLEDARSDDSPS
jgi:cytidine deaminase